MDFPLHIKKPSVFNFMQTMKQGMNSRELIQAYQGFDEQIDSYVQLVFANVAQQAQEQMEIVRRAAAANTAEYMRRIAELERATRAAA